jgi:hypothetical protein
LRRFLRGQGGDGYTSRGTGDEGLPSTPPPPLRGALGYSARGYEMGGVGGGSPVAAASLRFGQALARTPLRARMVVGGGAYALTDLMAGALRAHIRLAAPQARDGPPSLWSTPASKLWYHQLTPASATRAHAPSPHHLLAGCSLNVPPTAGGSGGAGGFCGVRTAFSQPDPPPSAPPLPTHEAPSAAPAATAPVIAAPAAPAAALTHSPVVVSPGAAGGPSGNGDETPAPWWADWDRRCVHALRSVRNSLSPVCRALESKIAGDMRRNRCACSRPTHNQRVVWGPQVVVGAAVIAPLLRGADAVLSSLLPYSRSQVRSHTACW